MTGWTLLGLAGLAVWLHLLTGRGGYWLARDRDEPVPAAPSRWPDVVAVVPARNEADVIGRAISSLLAQDYRGRLAVVVVDDGSSDGTGDVVRGLAVPPGRTLDVIDGAEPPTGWTGKLWALEQGLRFAEGPAAGGEGPRHVLLTDADIGHAPDNLSSLVARAEAEDRVLVSLMAELTCATPAERFLIPAFVYFFQMLYPFAWVRRRDRATAAAAGGCVLVRRDALAAAGGIASVRAEIIDDCALARRLKQQGAIWLGLTRRAASLRPYGGFAEIGAMVSRSAYAQLRYSPLLLAGTVLAMTVIFVAPALLAIFAEGAARWAGLAAWLLMALSFQPMLRFYRRSPLWGPALPAIAAAYTLFTLQSALAVWRGRGGLWKGRAQAMTSSP
ncbi:glycosyltransferase [Reyranella sp.]|uniref:glycosyltransferase n=1 Tax=Reyranella sp. TaxID=1929291 RepID=UPI003BACD97A